MTADDQMSNAVLKHLLVAHTARNIRLADALRGIRAGVADDKSTLAWWVRNECDKALTRNQEQQHEDHD